MIRKMLKRKNSRDMSIPFYEKEGSGMIYFGIAVAVIALNLINGLIVARNADKKHLDHA